MIVKKNCNLCGKQAILSREYDIGNLHFIQYTCGHISSKSKPKITDFKDFVSTDGKRPFKFQTEGAVFGLNSMGRVLIADEMGLGKTVQALMIAQNSGLRILVLGKAGLKVQWARECMRWLGEDKGITQIIDAEDEFLMPGVRGYVLSWDLLRRFKDIEGFMKRLKVNCVILDEVQHIKNSNTARTNAVREVCKYVDYIIALSGTPIENHPGEYFPILNILRPDKFPTKQRFDQQFTDNYFNGRQMKYGGMKNYKAFEEYTKDFIIRRRRIDVMPDLPVINRQFLFTDLGGEVEESYKNLLKEFQNKYNNTSGGEQNECILAYLAKMRHLTGIAKIVPTAEYVEDFLDSTDRKITIFLHHKDVSKLLRDKIANFTEVLDISDMPAEKRQDVIDEFKFNPRKRVLVASTLASGEGLNLQFCSDSVHMEREWNPSKEEQAEARFIRIGQMATNVTAMYPVAVGTVDEFFSELVEKKRAACSSALDGKEMEWKESSIMQELGEILAMKGGKKWGW